MKIIINGKPKEIAALAQEMQKPQCVYSESDLTRELVKSFFSAFTGSGCKNAQVLGPGSTLKMEKPK